MEWNQPGKHRLLPVEAATSSHSTSIYILQSRVKENEQAEAEDQGAARPIELDIEMARPQPEVYFVFMNFDPVYERLRADR
jgi:hypothetical protein